MTGYAGRGGELKYRPDIDILRAVAVLAVLGFHWNVSHFAGGFVGVDVFFVISGFLITQIVVREVESGRFSFIRFYERRIRRILPALYGVIFVVFSVAWFTLLPPLLLDLAHSVVAITIFSSNFLFWHEASYFAAPALSKPLLHTWSLAVEEQFYLVYPTLILLVFRYGKGAGKKHVILVLALVGIASFAVSVRQVHADPSSAFYLAPARAWEFILGAILVLAPVPPLRALRFRCSVLAIGAIMLIVGIYRFRSSTPFPGVAALLPCVGTALCIWANTGWRPALAESAFASVPLFYGKISYSLYLWHWPVWVFAKVLFPSTNDFSIPVKLSMFAFVTGLSFISYQLIEQPFRARDKISPLVLFASCGAVSILIILLGIAGTAFDGFPTRIPNEIAALADYANYPRALPYRERVCFLEPDQKVGEYDLSKCATPVAGARNVLLWGDSVAAHYRPGLERLAVGHSVQIMQANAAMCPPFFGFSQPVLPNCEALNNVVRAKLHESPPDLVIMSANWDSYAIALGYDRFMGLIRQAVAEVSSDGVPILFIGPSIQYTEPLPNLLAYLALRGADISRPQKLAKAEIFDLDRKMKADLEKSPKLTYVSILAANCPDQSCPLVVDGLMPVEWDSIHLTVAGSEHVIAAAASQISGPLFDRSP